MWIGRSVLPLAVAFGLVACDSGPSIVGEWSNVHPQGGPNTFTFREDGTATWAFEAEMVGTMELTYTIDYDVTPHHIEITGFESGPLAGVTMYGIIEFDEDVAFRVDFEPGPPDAAADEIRPNEFTHQTQFYTRISPE
jgi:hypothetical protein